MTTVPCENPKCKRIIPTEAAYSFTDGEDVVHYACNRDTCRLRALLEVGRKAQELEVYKEVMDGRE